MKKGEVSRELEACLLIEEVSWRQVQNPVT
jgi:hypothetical protein